MTVTDVVGLGSTRYDQCWMSAGEVERDSFFADPTQDHIPAVALADAAVRAAAVMLGRVDRDRDSSAVTALVVAFPEPCRRGVRTDLRLAAPDLWRGASGVRFAVGQGRVEVCRGQVWVSHSRDDELFAPWILDPGSRAGHTLLDKAEPWRVLVGPPRRTPDSRLTATMVGPSAPGDAGVQQVSLLLEAVCQVATLVAKADDDQDVRFDVRSLTLTLTGGGPWLSYPTLECLAWDRTAGLGRALIGVSVDGVSGGEVLVSGVLRR
ncbi:hypothetical protein [Actinokineospora pegani]|uniref:hypothetical protein n=1 Tax=Actinokineospora pegani TaxID=2654637 RepID=UPI0012EAB6A8|nr:hypothetical protein [Actinokineospora pegani]